MSKSADDEPICLEPARTVLTRLGEAQRDLWAEPRMGRKPSIVGMGIRLAKRITGRNLARVYRWGYPRERDGYDGYIPYADAEKILAYAAKHNIDIAADDFFVARVDR